MPGMPNIDKSTLRKLWSRATSAILQTIVDRVVDDKAFPRCQVEWLADRISPDVEYRQPQGLYFVPKTGAEGLLAAPAGDRSAAVVFCAQAREDSPGSGGIAEGEGGLYYAGEFKVFLDSSGNVHLGAKSGSDYVALASQIDTVLGAIDTIMRGGTLPTPGGGAALQAAYLAAVTTPYTTAAATKVKAT